MELSMPVGVPVPEITKVAVLALLDNGLTCVDICKETKINVKTIAKIRDDKELRAKFRNSAELAGIKKRLQNRFFREAHRSLDNIDQDKLDKASAYQLAGMSALFTSKGMEMENQGKDSAPLNFSVLIHNSYDGDKNRTQPKQTIDVKATRK
jgi:hypothetical protein